MNRDTEIELVRRALVHIDARTTDQGTGATKTPRSTYTDPVRYEREVEALFRQTPTAIAHRAVVAEAGEYVTHDDSGRPLLIVRGDDGELRVFLNVCRHRGTRLESAPCGRKRAFSCPYHSWTYDTEGALTAIPHAYGFAGIGTRGLARVTATEAGGLVWLGGADVGTFLGEEILSDLVGFGLGSAHVYEQRRMTRAINWKLAIDVFLEAYHLRPTHRASIYPMFFDNLGLVDRIGPHLRNVFPKRTIRELRSSPETSWELRRHANVLFHLFPNTLVLVEPDHAFVAHVWPDGPSRTHITSYTLVPEPPRTDKARAYWDANVAILHGAVEEDLAMAESIQRGLSSGANEDFVFGAFEHALQHFHGEIDRRVSTKECEAAAPEAAAQKERGGRPGGTR